MLRRLSLFLAFSLLFAYVIGGCDSSELDASDCDPTCTAQVNWYLSASLTAHRQWFASVVRDMPEARCIRHRESRDTYTAENASSSASGAYQFLLGTSDNVSRAMGRFDLVGRPAGTWPAWDQDLAWAYAFSRYGMQPWGGSCG